MQLQGSTALVTGTNSGMGRHFAIELLRRGVKVYATARRPELVDIPGAEVLHVDITDQTSIEAAAEVATDVDLLINNGAYMGIGSLVSGDLNVVRQLMESHYFGTLSMIRAFAPVLASNGGGAILNVLSAVAWTTVESNTALAAAKSAQWGLTNGVRVELADQGTLVAAFVPGLVASETLKEAMKASGITLPEDPMIEPDYLVRLALDGIEAGEVEILDRFGAEAKASLSGPPGTFDLTALT
ncbi:short-subunit dehydrogenase [Lipingzhangella halophila]|uniref:Short-subunit dehydrogenase n=1 Tax=Lipingzhangella halophila TaxID=1783352 RepID=A0A7W7W1T6_9ACTN|nr:SDR family NAD(P)-dependent oxidoreductase [Lipingzhangella halophila]MBB4930643.1 short-subunit dehydrogenase [Lipingzhangella halophila]